MQFDIPSRLNAVTRSVRTVERDGRPARVVVASRRYDAPMEDVWDALTNPERIPRWFAPVSGELRLGGSYQVEGNAGGEITDCVPPRHFGLTWKMGPEPSWVHVRLSSEGDGTRLELEHTAHVDDAFWNQYGPGAVGVGWDLSLLGLDLYLTTGFTKQADTDAWPTTDEGRRFVRGASEDWGRASIAAGTDDAAAQAAVEATTEFYTGAGGPTD